MWMLSFIRISFIFYWLRIYIFFTLLYTRRFSHHVSPMIILISCAIPGFLKKNLYIFSLFNNNHSSLFFKNFSCCRVVSKDISVIVPPVLSSIYLTVVGLLADSLIHLEFISLHGPTSFFYLWLLTTFLNNTISLLEILLPPPYGC